MELKGFRETDLNIKVDTRVIADGKPDSYIAPCLRQS